MRRPSGTSSRILVLLSLVFAFVLGAGNAARADGLPTSRPVTKEGAEQLRALIAGIGDFRVTEVAYDSYMFGLYDKSGQRIGDLGVHLDGEQVPRFRSQHYMMDIGNLTPETSVVDTLVRAAHVIAAADGGELPATGVKIAKQPFTQLYVTVAMAILFAVLLAWGKRDKISSDIRTVHIIQFCTQSSILIYWALYWPGVAVQVPIIVLHLLLAFAVDAAFAFARFGSWRFSFSPVPVVLSINLFEWFDPNASILAIVGAFACKALVRRGNSHIFNPSVAGLTIVGIVSILWPDFVHFGGLFHTFNLAPNMAEFVVLVSLVPQIKFRVLPVTIASAAALALTGNPAVTRPTIILAFTLLATDPATSPRSDFGKILFGAFIGFMLPQCSKLFVWLHQPDDFAKILSVAAANFLVPQFDWVTRKTNSALSAAWMWIKESQPELATGKPLQWLAARVQRPVHNYALVGLWILVIVPLVAEEKVRDFEPALHWTWGTPLIVRDADDVPRCENNPVFCKPFSFPQEIGMWLKGKPAAPMPQPVAGDKVGAVLPAQ